MRRLFSKLGQSPRILEITQKVRQNPTSFVSLRDFEVVQEAKIALADIANHPGISLYCLNHFEKEAIFVETPAGVDLSQFPFLYQAQYEQAQRLISMTYRQFYRLARMLAGPKKRLIFIHSVGRCGSTLLSRVFNSLDNVLSLSEPEAFTEIVKRREADGSNEAEITRLLSAILQVQCRPTWHGQPDVYVIKFRSFSTVLIDLLHQVAPDARHIFLYRNAEDRARSMARAFKTTAVKTEAMDAANLRVRSKFVPLLAHYADRATGGTLSQVEFSMLAWLSGMERYLELHTQGVPMCAVRYEDMIAAPTSIVSQLFDYCQLPASEVEPACQAFDTDSQAGSSLAQDTIGQNGKHDLSTEHLAQIRQLFPQHPTIKTADFILPGTLQIT